ncbi:MAG TPA: thioredoxin fold domain-containing protein [Flavobacterium sp.]|jgi:thioredoxin-related protein
MKNFFLALFIVAGSLGIQAQEIKWLSLDEALAAQKKKPKPIFMDVYTDWCGPCKMLDKNTFNNKAVVDYVTANYYAVKFNAEGNSEVNYKGKKYTNPAFDAGRRGRNSAHEFGYLLKIQGYPTMVVFNTKGEIVNNIVGYRTAEELLPELKK